MIELWSRGVSASIDPARGGRLASLTIAGRERLVGPSDEQDRSIHWGCFLMAPWPGRLEDGILRWEGRTYRVPQTLGRHAIHGLVYGQPWLVQRSTTSEVELTCSLGAAGWPFGGSVRQGIELRQGSLIFEAVIEADRPMPAALGWHPWFQRGEGDATLRVDAPAVLRTRGLIPTGERTPVSGMTDLRRGPRIGKRRLDHTYIDVESEAVIGWPDLELCIESQAPVSTVVVHTTATSFCVEPQTAWPNALGGDGRHAAVAGATSLAAGETLRAAIQFRWSPAARDQ